MERAVDNIIGSGLSQQFTVSTIMATIALNQKVNLLHMARYIPGGNTIFDPHAVALVNANGKVKNTFRNQATVELPMGDRRVTASVFSNGTIKLTGCQSQDECNRAARLIVSRIKKTRGVGLRGEPLLAVACPERLAYSGMEVGMVKCDCDLGFGISLEKLFPIISAHFPGSSFAPEVYCGLKTVVALEGCNKNVTVCLFHTGKAFVSGRMSFEDVASAFDKVSSVVLGARSTVEVFGPQKQRVVAKSKKRSSSDEDMPSLEELLGFVLNEPMPVSAAKRSAKTQFIIRGTEGGAETVLSEVPVIDAVPFTAALQENRVFNLATQAA